MLLTGCSLTDPTNLGTSTSTLEEVPADVATNDTTIPEIEPLAGGSEQLIGFWKSSCLIPDQDSDYAEQHYFVFYPNRTATYTAESFYKRSCTGPDNTLIHNYSYSIPTAGQINLTELSTGKTLYDIYQIQTGSLMFGQGFRNNFPYPSSVGLSATDRFTTLNQYIVYSKVE